jgi:hypothetical protein
MEQPPVLPQRFVPSGVDAKSWMGFEERIQERRFRALLETARASIAAGDGESARAALEEARELRPSAPELDAYDARLTALACVSPRAAIDVNGARILSAAGLLLFGISLVSGIDYLRSSPSQAPVVRSVPLDAAAPREPVAPLAPPADVPRPARRAPALGTTGLDVPVAADSVPVDLQPAQPPASEPLPPGEVSDDFVYPAPADVAPPSSRSIPLSPSVAPTRVAPAALPGPAPAARATGVIADVAAAPVAAAVLPSPRVVVPDTARDRQRINDTLHAYARAYERLDAAAARQVWPSVNERALARAFAGLATQDIAFDSCSIDLRGGSARAQCRGRATYVGKVGGGAPHTEARRWDFQLSRDGEDWKIDSANVN